MKRIVASLIVSMLCIISSYTLLLAVETAPRITDREIIERLTRVEEGQNSIRNEIRQLRDDMKLQGQQLREDMNAQFDRMTTMMVGIMGAFAAIVAVTISFAIWDRRTMVRPFESKIKKIEEELARNRQQLHSFLDAMRALSQNDQGVAKVLKKFHLL